MTKIKIIIFLFGVVLMNGNLLLYKNLVTYADAGTYSEYTGKTQEDISLARIVYEAGKNTGIIGVEVSDGIMVVNVTMELYRQMYNDRISGNQIMRSWQKMIAKEYDKTNGLIGTVDLYVNGQEVAQCEASMWGEVKVKWFDD